MSRTDYYGEQRVCSDCIMFIVNGETPPEMDETETADYVAKTIASQPAGFHWVAGDCGEYGERHDEFSWSPCDCCGSTLGGSRCVAHLLEMGPIRRTIAYGDRVTVLCPDGEHTGTLIQRRKVTADNYNVTTYTVWWQASPNGLGRTFTGTYVRGVMLSWADRAEALAKADRAGYLATARPFGQGRKWVNETRAEAVAASWQ